MKLVNPLGKESQVSVAAYGFTPFAGCACSNVNGEWLTDMVRDDCGCCHCYCSYGPEKLIANENLALE